MYLLTSLAVPLLLLTSAAPKLAYRPAATPASHGAAPAASGSVMQSGTLTGSVTASGAESGTGRIDMLRAARLAAHPGVTPMHESAPTHADNHTGVYISVGSAKRDDFVQQTIQSVLKAGGTSVVVDVKGGRVYYPSQAPMANQLGLVVTGYDVDHFLQEAHAAGLYVIARFVTLKDDGLSTKDPDTMVKNPKTGAKLSPGWTDPGNPVTQEYNDEIICELAQKGFDEINFDYIRFSTSDFGNLYVYSADQKADRLASFLQAARDTVNRCGPNTKLGISTFAIIGWDYDVNVRTLGQDVKRLAQYVDVISPMAYPATFTSPEYYTPGKDPRSRMYWLVYHTLTGYKAELGDNWIKLRPWIQGYYITSKDFRDEMDAVTDAGLCGFQVWNANNNYGPVYQAMSNWTQPESCKD